MTAVYILYIIACYLLGATPFMIWIGRAKGFDLSHEPDLHHALWHRVGRVWGALGLGLDILKGAVPPFVSLLIGFPIAVTALCGLSALCGQMWPVFRRFNGERGNTTGAGIGITLSFAYDAPLIFIIIFVIVAIGFLTRFIHKWEENGSSLNESLKLNGSPSRSFPLSCLIGFASMPITSAILELPLEITLGYAAILLLILIRRLTAGLMADLKNSKKPLIVIINRLLYDRSDA